MEKRTILFIDTAINIGGGQKSLMLLLKHIDRNKYRPLVAISVGSKLMDDVAGGNITVVPLSMRWRTMTREGGRIRQWFRMIVDGGIVLGEILAIVKKYHVSLIHANTTEAGLLGGLAGRLAAVPVIYHNRISVIKPIVTRLIDMLATKVIFVSHGSMWPWVRKRSAEKYCVVYNAIDIETFDQRARTDGIRQTFRIPDNHILIGTVSRISPEKGLEFFIRAMPSVLNRFDRAHFIIVGGPYFPSDEQYLQTLKDEARQLGVEKNLTFTGFMDNIPAVMHELDIVVTVSFHEALSRVPLEAMAAGKPVIATAVTGNDESVVHEETGVLVPVKDVEALESALVKLLREPERRQEMGQAGRQRIEKMFTIDHQMAAIDSIYHQLCHQKKDVSD